MTDALPRLQILRKAGPVPWEAIDHFLVSEGVPAIRESLRLLGVREEAIVNHSLFLENICVDSVALQLTLDAMELC
jgi:hypothetical protein